SFGVPTHAAKMATMRGTVALPPMKRSGSNRSIGKRTHQWSMLSSNSLVHTRETPGNHKKKVFGNLSKVRRQDAQRCPRCEMQTPPCKKEEAQHLQKTYKRHFDPPKIRNAAQFKTQEKVSRPECCHKKCEMPRIVRVAKNQKRRVLPVKFALAVAF
ncbi:hypothetical protein TcCL_NonESM04303, partial [Trypanosoma cruzi]